MELHYGAKAEMAEVVCTHNLFERKGGSRFCKRLYEKSGVLRKSQIEDLREPKWDPYTSQRWGMEAKLRPALAHPVALWVEVDDLIWRYSGLKPLHIHLVHELQFSVYIVSQSSNTSIAK